GNESRSLRTVSKSATRIKFVRGPTEMHLQLIIKSFSLATSQLQIPTKLCPQALQISCRLSGKRGRPGSGDLFLEPRRFLVFLVVAWFHVLAPTEHPIRVGLEVRRYFRQTGELGFVTNVESN